jgi:hypothetical protein
MLKVYIFPPERFLCFLVGFIAVIVLNLNRQIDFYTFDYICIFPNEITLILCFTVAIMTRLTTTMCDTNDHGYVPFVDVAIKSSPASWLIVEFLTKLTRHVSLESGGTGTTYPSEYLSSYPGFVGVVHFIQCHVFSLILVLYCDIRYHFLVDTMLGSSLFPVVL